MVFCKICRKEVHEADGIRGQTTFKVCSKCGRQGCSNCIKTDRCNTCEARRPKALDEPRALAVSSKDMAE